MSEIFRPPFARRTTMLLLLNVFQAIGFSGFNNWVPALMASQGASFVKSLQYSFFVPTLFPVASLSCLLIAATCAAVFGLAFSQQFTAARLITFGALLTVANVLLSYPRCLAASSSHSFGKGLDRLASSPFSRPHSS